MVRRLGDAIENDIAFGVESDRSLAADWQGVDFFDRRDKLVGAVGVDRFGFSRRARGLRPYPSNGRGQSMPETHKGRRGRG